MEEAEKDEDEEEEEKKEATERNEVRGKTNEEGEP